MKVKVGDKVYSSTEQPIMVILSEHDKYYIRHMAAEATRYAEFSHELDWTEEQKLVWMREGVEG